MNKVYSNRSVAGGGMAMSEERFSDRAYAILRDRLVMLHYQPMQPLNERELTVELGLGLAPIREALRRLESDHLVAIYPRRGIFAAEIGIRDQQSIREVRVEIEGLAASLAAVRGMPEEKDALVAAAEDLVHEKVQSRSIDGDADIHRRIYAMSRNPFLETTLILHFNLALRLWYFCSRNAQAPDPRPVDHRGLAVAIKAGDARGAQALLQAHVEEDSGRIRDLLFSKLG